jgi:selenocysteine lyase/cysteine desulfurase
VSDRAFRDVRGALPEAAAGSSHDVVYLSQVFFNSGHAVQGLAGIVDAVKDQRTLIVIDGYHGFCALPTSLRGIETRAFYMSGGYKYAQAGEGACFLHVPAGCALRPANTGWFCPPSATSPASSPKASPIPMTASGSGAPPRSWGALSPQRGHGPSRPDRVPVAVLHAHVRALQERFLDGLAQRAPRTLPLSSLLTGRDLSRQGHFLVFDIPGAQALWDAARRAGGRPGCPRKPGIRFGFGLYQDASDVDQLSGEARRL